MDRIKRIKDKVDLWQYLFYEERNEKRKRFCHDRWKQYYQIWLVRLGRLERERQNVF